MPYVTMVRDGVTPSAIPAFNDVHHNMIVANYAADGGCLDNDDGSCWYKIHDNACLYGGHKSDFDGHSKWSYDNLHLYASVYGDRCVEIGAQVLPLPGFPDIYANNTCVLVPNAECLDLGQSAAGFPAPGADIASRFQWYALGVRARDIYEYPDDHFIELFDDESRRFFYYNVTTGKSQWFKPKTFEIYLDADAKAEEAAVAAVVLSQVGKANAIGANAAKTNVATLGMSAR